MTAAPAIKRKPLTGKRRAEFFEAHDGRCYLCGEKIKAGEAWDDEHVIQLWVSEDDSLDNRRPAHRDTCHKAKTAADAKVRGKVKRLIARENGTRRARKPIPQRAGGWPKGRKLPSKNQNRKLGGYAVAESDEVNPTTPSKGIKNV